MIEKASRVLIGALALALAAGARANGGGHVATPPIDFTEIAPGSVEVMLKDVNVRHAVEADGALWAATDKGVATRAATGAWTWLDARSGWLPDDAVERVARWRGRTCAGLARGGLALLREKGFDRVVKPHLPSDEIVDLAVHRDELWAVTDAGLARLAKDGPAGVPQAGTPPRGLPTTVASGFDGKLWIGTDQAEIAAWDGKAWVTHGFDGMIVGRTIRAVAPAFGHIWFGTYGSLNAFTPGTGRLDDETAEKAVLFPTRLIKSIAADDKRLLVVTGGGGLYRFDAATQLWHLYTDANGLPSLSIHSVTLARDVALVATNAGLARIDLTKPLPGDLRRAREAERPAGRSSAAAEEGGRGAAPLPMTEKPLSSPSPKEAPR